MLSSTRSFVYPRSVSYLSRRSRRPMPTASVDPAVRISQFSSFLPAALCISLLSLVDRCRQRRLFINTCPPSEASTASPLELDAGISHLAVVPLVSTDAHRNLELSKTKLPGFFPTCKPVRLALGANMLWLKSLRRRYGITQQMSSSKKFNDNLEILINMQQCL